MCTLNFKTLLVVDEAQSLKLYFCRTSYMRLGRLPQVVFRCYTYFKRAHAAYFAFLLSLANFVVIQYRLVIEYVPFLKTVFPNLLTFAICFIVTYGILTIFIGRLDFKKGAFRVEAAIAASSSPYDRDMARALSLLSEAIKHIVEGNKQGALERLEEVRKTLEKWYSRS